MKGTVVKVNGRRASDANLRQRAFKRVTSFVEARVGAPASGRRPALGGPRRRSVSEHAAP
jgi:hypothetical protein